MREGYSVARNGYMRNVLRTLHETEHRKLLRNTERYIANILLKITKTH